MALLTSRVHFYRPKRSAAHRVTLVKPPQLVVQLGICAAWNNVGSRGSLVRLERIAGGLDLPPQSVLEESGVEV